jgi:hypothetical protein
MTRLKDYILNESTYKLEDILPKCSDIIRVYRNTKEYLYRGVGSDLDIIKKKSRKKRIPKDTPIEVHKAADKLFMKRFGWKARSSGVFVTSDEGDADAYGYTYIFLPVNGYSFLWSPSVNDFTVDLQTEGILKYWMGYELAIDIKDAEKRLENIIKTYKKTNLKQAIESGNEIMFNCTEYYLIGEKYWLDMNNITGIK